MRSLTRRKVRYNRFLDLLDLNVCLNLGYHSKDRLAPQWMLELQEKELSISLNRPGTAEGSSEEGRSSGKYGSSSTLSRKTKVAPPAIPYEKVVVAGAGQDMVRPTTAAAIGPRRYERDLDVDTSKRNEDNLRDDTAATRQHSSQLDLGSSITTKASVKPSLSSSISAPSGPYSLSEQDLVAGKVVGLLLESTWGDKSYVGLTGIEVLLGVGCVTATDLNPKECISAEPWDLSAIGCFDDYRTPYNLLNGVNDCTDDHNMWLIPYTRKGRHSLNIDLGSQCKIAGVKVWNYNKCLEDTLRGAQKVAVVVDGAIVGRTLLRPGPGCDGVEFGQVVLFRDLLRPRKEKVFSSVEPTASEALSANTSAAGHQQQQLSYIRYITPAIRQDYEVPLLPSGMMLKFVFYSNWGDFYYIGLDAIEIYDENGVKINVAERGMITAVPHSLRDLEVSARDSRVPDNLVNDVSRDPSGTNSWLAPLAPCMTRQERAESVLRVMRRQRGYDSVKRRYEKVRTVPTGYHATERGYNMSPAADDDDPLQLFPENSLFVMFHEPVSIAFIRCVCIQKYAVVRSHLRYNCELNFVQII